MPLVRCASIPLFCPSRHIVQWGMGGGHCFFPFGFSSKSTCPGGFLCVITSPPRCGVAEKGTACSRSTASASSVLSFDVRFLSRRGIARGIQPRLELGIRKAHRGRPEVVCVVAISRVTNRHACAVSRKPEVRNQGRNASRALPEITTGHSRRPTQDSGSMAIKQHKAPGPGFTELQNRPLIRMVHGR